MDPLHDSPENDSSSGESNSTFGRELDLRRPSPRRNGPIAIAPLMKPRRFALVSALERTLRAFSPAERLFLYVLTIVLGVSTLALLYGANASVSVRVPSHGGALVEGEIGPARFVNPVITMSQADEDLTALVYSGLMRARADGSFVPGLAQSYDISADGLTYTFKIRPDAKFQDGSPLTSADVLFTVHLAQDPTIKSPHRADWEGVAVSAPDSQTIVFKLPKAYAPFLENTTLGILPEKLWKNISAEEFPFSPLNTHPIGSGPYKASNVDTDSTGSVTRYDLVPFNEFTIDKPYLGRITFLFYPNESELVQALNGHKIDAIAGLSADQVAAIKRTDVRFLTSVLPRTFGIFFNQSHNPVLGDASVRNALNQAIDKQGLVNSVLHGYGVPLQGPIPPGIIDSSAPPASHIDASSTPAFTDATLNQARATLTSGGWSYASSTGMWTNSKKQQLSFSVATADAPELVATANAVAEAWRALGAKVSVQVYPLSELNTSIIRPRNYDAILFGEVVGRDLDLFAFWHSSQRNDPGLNLSLYTNAQADTLLTQARATTDRAAREKLYSQFSTQLAKDTPAVFLYAPEFVYVVPAELRGVELGALNQPSDRFLGAYTWYTDTERVWSIFSKDSQGVI